uniref:TetR/AcrR family transcriptional regulator n=1 Tax=uncultured Sphingomonas sp. TaxID=158754 RepID=UPI0035CA9F08
MSSQLSQARLPAVESAARSHNLLGQRLGRKGRDTRERILGALPRVLADPADTPLSLTAIAREASIGMTTLYLYFADMSELLLAALEPLGAEADALRNRFDHHWPDGTLEEECVSFLKAHHMFWSEHSRLLHLRNSLADTGDLRMLESRRAMSRPVLACLTRQMPDRVAANGSASANYAVVLMTMLERMATITTDATFARDLTTPDGGGAEAFVADTLQAEAKIIALTIRNLR